MPCGVIETGIVVGDDDLLVFASGFLGHTVGACGVEDVKLLVQIYDEGAVVVGNHHKPLALQKRIVEALVAFLGKAHRIAVLRIVVRRVTVEECVFPVILADEVDAVLVLDDHLRQSA